MPPEELSRLIEHRVRARLERLQPLLERAPGSIDRRRIGVPRNVERLADRDRDRRERLRNLRAIPAVHRPAAIGLDMERHHRIAGRLRQPDGAGLCEPRGAARSVHGERSGPAGRHVARQLQQRPACAARGRPARRAVAEALDDAGNPLAVEVLARDHHDAAPPEIVRRGKDAAVPERHDRLPAAPDDAVVVIDAVALPAKRRSEQRNQPVADDRDQLRLNPFQSRRAPVGHFRGRLATRFRSPERLALRWARGPATLVARASQTLVTPGSQTLVARGSQTLVARGSQTPVAPGTQMLVARGSQTLVARGFQPSGCILPLTYVIRSTNWISPTGPPAAPALAEAPLSMIEQNGHAVTTVVAPVSRSCLKRTSLMRDPGSSSLSANSSPPPAPQQ